MMSRRTFLAAAALLAGALAYPASAAEKLTVSIGQRGGWDTWIIPLGIEAGIFARHGLEVAPLWTTGGADTLNPTLVGSAQYSVGPPLASVLAAYEKGAAVRVMGNQMRGARDIFWYVKAESPIKSLKDADGKSVSYSRVGSATHIVVTALADRYGIKPKFVGTGTIPATRTQVFTDQIDVGWGSASQLVDMFQSGQARIIARGAELADYNDVTLRAVSANADFVRQQPKVAKAFDAAYQDSVDWVYTNLDKALAVFCKEFNLPVDAMRQRVTEFYPKEAVSLWPVTGIDRQIAEAIQFKSISKAPTEAQLKELIVDTRTWR
jgi:NitT/TauT family transport system substrate-binding protein